VTAALYPHVGGTGDGRGRHRHHRQHATQAGLGRDPSGRWL